MMDPQPYLQEESIALDSILVEVTQEGQPRKELRPERLERYEELRKLWGIDDTTKTARDPNDPSNPQKP